MTKRVLFASLAMIAALGLALVAGAQRPGGPGPRLREDFGHGGGPGGLGGPPCTSGCPVYQYTYTRTITQPVFSNGSSTPTTITNTSTGTIASYSDGSSYREVTMSAVGPWQSASGPQQFIYVRDMGAMMNYIEHVGKSGTTYEKFAIKPPLAPNPNSKGVGPRGGPGGGSVNNQVSPKSIVLPDNTPCNAEETTITRGDSVTHRVYCPALRLLVQEERNDRFGQSTYVLGPSTGAAPTSFPFVPKGTLVTRGQFGHGGRPGGGGI